jgi:integrase
VLDRLGAELGPGRQLADVPGEEIAAALRRLWGKYAPATRNRNRAAVVSWLTWCAQKKRWPAPQLPPDAERRTENNDATSALPRGRVERLLSRRDIPLREKTLWRMLYETAARASEILGLNVEDLDLEQRRAAVRSKGGDTEFVYWDTGTAHLLPRLLRLPDGTSRASGPLFLASRRPIPALRPGTPVTSARTPAGAAWATTAPGSCSRSTPLPPPAPAWNSVTRRSRCS